MAPFVLLAVLLAALQFVAARPKEGLVSKKFRKEIQDYSEIAKKIIDYSLNGSGQNQSYNRLAEFTDKFGARISGSQNLENAIDYMLEKLTDDGLENVHGEEVNVTHWVRNQEYARLLFPREYNFTILGLGKSVGTPPEGITADAIVVSSFDELSDRVKGKIVIYNEPYNGYGVTAIYRVLGANRASQYGAVATLIRTVGPFSIYSPHTGVQEYEDAEVKIPTACITIEDAEMFARMQQRGEPIRLLMYMGAQNLNQSVSRNTVAEIKGYMYPEQVVVVSGHMDSWDVGQGAMDDGGGAFISWQALTIVKNLGLRPKRTLRMIMWTDEEDGGVGAAQYYDQHKADAGNFSILFESDMGVFTPYGIQFAGSDKAKAMMQQIGLLVQSINVSEIYDEGEGTDVNYWRKQDVPVASLANHNDKYFWFHHSNGDTIEVLDPIEMNLCSAAWTVYAYVLADMNDLLPRG